MDVCDSRRVTVPKCFHRFWSNHPSDPEEVGVIITDLYKYSPDAVPPIHAVSYHVATDKPPAQDGDKFRSIFSDNLQPIATRGKKARGTQLVDQNCGNGCSIKRARISVSYYNEISSGHIGRELFGGGALPAQYCPRGLWL